MRNSIVVLVIVLFVLNHDATSQQACILYNLTDSCSDQTQQRGACDYVSSGELCYEIRIDLDRSFEAMQRRKSQRRINGRSKRSLAISDLVLYHFEQLLKKRNKRMSDM